MVDLLVFKVHFVVPLWSMTCNSKNFCKPKRVKFDTFGVTVNYIEGTFDLALLRVILGTI